MHRRLRLSALAGRPAFTLIELIIVIVIIAILSSLILVAVNSAISRARIAGVVTEIKSLEKAIADFKLEFGIEPPSFFVFYENGADWAGTSDEQRRSREIIRKIWPTFLNTANAPTGGYDDDGDTYSDFDLNFDGDYVDPIFFNGAECLVFFLGGVTFIEDTDGDLIYDTGEGRFQTGFASNPANPFEILPTSTLSNRTQFYDFDIDRLVDVDGDFVPEFVDELANQDMPYQYFSAYEGNGYRPYGLDGTRNTGDDETLREGGEIVGPEAAYYSNFLPRTNYGQKTFQIISPGADGEFFPDDQRPLAAAPPWPVPPSRAPNLTTAPGFGEYDGETAESQVERDNITNFKGGVLN